MTTSTTNTALWCVIIITVLMDLMNNKLAFLSSGHSHYRSSSPSDPSDKSTARGCCQNGVTEFRVLLSVIRWHPLAPTTHYLPSNHSNLPDPLMSKCSRKVEIRTSQRWFWGTAEPHTHTPILEEPCGSPTFQQDLISPFPPTPDGHTLFVRHYVDDSTEQGHREVTSL